MVCEKRGEHLDFGMIEDQIDLFTGITMENHLEKLMKSVRCRFLRFFHDDVTGRRGDRVHQNGRRMAARRPDFLLVSPGNPGRLAGWVITNVGFLVK